MNIFIENYLSKENNPLVKIHIYILYLEKDLNTMIKGKPLNVLFIPQRRATSTKLVHHVNLTNEWHRKLQFYVNNFKQYFSNNSL